MSKQTYKTLWKQVEKSKWKVITCQQGKSCWCRIITTVDEVDAGDGPEHYRIVHSGSLQKEAAEHIVKLHNQSIEQ